jgi:hypothetical protein
MCALFAIVPAQCSEATQAPKAQNAREGIVNLTIISLIHHRWLGKRASSVQPMVAFPIGFHLS